MIVLFWFLMAATALATTHFAIVGFVRNYTTRSGDAYIFPSREYLLAALLLTATIVLNKVI